MSLLHLLLATAISATASASPAPPASPSPVLLGHMVAVAVGETVDVEGGLTLSFLSVAEDSRCPADVVCVWEGNAQVELEARIEGEEAFSIELDTNPGFQTELSYPGFTIGLVGLEPYPRSDTPMSEPYHAILLVTAADPRPIQ
jgi:hypothetical protein